VQGEVLPGATVVSVVGLARVLISQYLKDRVPEGSGAATSRVSAMAQLCKYVERMWTPNLYGAVGASDGVTSLCLVELFGDFGLYVFYGFC
jgi:hypothetical protein